MLTYLVYKGFRKIRSIYFSFKDKIYSKFVFSGNGVVFENFRTVGVPFVMIARGGKCSIGRDFAMNNGIKGNPIGCHDNCTIFVDKGASLLIGENVGISQTALICHQNISIGDNVKIGGGTKIYDTDFHSLDSKTRNSKADLKNKIKMPVIIEDNVFIGAYSIVLKGVTIGENSIVGAGSIVTKSIPSNQIWAGNPAKFIRNL
jgi:acetyltransferase-like isoleucine patch superfamily enzyme